MTQKKADINPKVLSLQGKGLKLDTAADIEPWLSGYDPALVEEIHLGGNTIGVDASKELSKFITRASALRIADLADIFTGRLITEIPDALTAICDALIDKSSLVEINLSDNAFGGRSVDPMVPFLTRNRHFQILKLNNNGLGPAGGAVIANALLDSARLSRAEGKVSRLHTVICGRNRLENGSAPAWAEAFAAHGTLREVRMPQNGIRMEGISALARGLANSTSLQHLDLQDNTFTADGSEAAVKAWAEILPSFTELHTLNFSDCVLSGDGEIPVLLQVVASGSNPNLRVLQLQNNNLEAQSFALLSSAIESNLRNLVSLELQWNEAEEDDESLESLRAALKARGGKLYATDEDEDEEDEEEEDLVVKEAEEAEEEEPKETETQVVGGDVTTQKTTVDKESDELANMMSKVKIGS